MIAERTGLGDWYDDAYTAALRTIGVLVPGVGIVEIGREAEQSVSQALTVPPGQNRDAYNPMFWGNWNLTNAATEGYYTVQAAIDGTKKALTPSGWSWTTIALVAVGAVIVIAVVSKK
jgi:uncharacterized membrane protein YidH (DUF202 family)